VANLFYPEFRREEFRYPDQVNQRALNYLLAVRETYGKPMILTGDWRPLGYLPTGGSNSSLHYEGKAFDGRSRGMSREDRWNLTRAVILVARMIPQAERGVELEWVLGGPAEHWHIGFFLDGRADRLILLPE
jgi:hypothetical protein